MKEPTVDSKKSPVIKPDKDLESKKENKENLPAQNNTEAAKTKKDYALEEKEAQENIKKGIEADLFKKEELRQNELIIEKLKTIGLNDSDLKNDPNWGELSFGEKLLAIEQLSQDTLSNIKEIGEKKFQEKNKINPTWNPIKWKPYSGLIKKIGKNITKSVWISKEEKDVLKDFENGTLKPSANSIKQIIERTKDMGLNVTEKDGKASIEFIPVNKKMSEDQRIIIENYNKAANDFAKMPDSWRNEKAAKGKDGGVIKNKNYENFKKIESQYENAKLDLLSIKKESYVEKGSSEKIAELKAMNSLVGYDKQVAILQFINTNPDVLKELNKIKNEKSWGRLINNENLWRGGYMAIGAGARAITVSTFGAIAAPVVAIIIGGARARRKAEQKINKAFDEGRSIETSKERREKNKKGLFDDKDATRGLASQLLTGQNINTKEVGAFIDADSQIQRLDNLIEKIEKTKDRKEKMLLKDQLFARINYIEDKHEAGLINYGTKNKIGANYELLKKMSFARVQLGTFNFIENKNVVKNTQRRETLLTKIIDNNNLEFNKNQSDYKLSETIRGAVIAGGFSHLAWRIKDLFANFAEEDGVVLGELDNYAKYKNIDLEKLKELENLHPERLSGLTKEIGIEHATIGAGSTNGLGAIKTISLLKKNLLEEYGDNIKDAPGDIKHIIETDAQKLAQEYGMYKPNNVNESTFDLKFIKVDTKGNVTYQKIGDDTYYEVDGTYKGKMFDSDHSGLKIKTDNIIDDKYKLPPQSDPTTIEKPTLEVESDLTPDEIEELNETHLENLNRIFPNLKDWENIKNVTPAGKLFTMEEVADQYKPLVSYVKNLKEITGLDPAPNETIPAYIKRALQEAQENGDLDKTIYPKNGIIEQVNQEAIPKQVDPKTVIPTTRPIVEEAIDQPAVEQPKVEEDTFIKPEEVEAKPVINKTPTKEIQTEPTHTEVNKDTPLSFEDKREIFNVSEDNLEKIYPNEIDRSMIWETIQNYKIGLIIGENKIKNFTEIFIKYDEKSLQDSFASLSSYINKLEKVSGLKPMLKSETIFKEESVSNYINRALEKIQRMGKMEDIKL